MWQEDPLAALGIEGPVQLEVFVLWLDDRSIALTGPCGAAPWYIETGAGEHPVDVVRRIVTDVVGEPELVHSTSWRQGPDGVILTFFVVIDPALAAPMESRSVVRGELARSAAAAPPAVIAPDQVLEHAIRHLAWLARDDDVVRARLSPGWRGALAAHAPEPFRNLG